MGLRSALTGVIKGLRKKVSYHFTSHQFSFKYGELKSSDVQSAVSGWNGGFFGVLNRVIKSMITNDTHIQAVVQTRKQSVLSAGYFFSSKEKEKVKKQLDYLNDPLFEHLLNRMIGDLMDGTFVGVKILELVWKSDGSKWYVDDYLQPSLDNFVFKDGKWKRIINQGHYGAEQYADLEPYKYIVYTPMRYEGKPYGCLQAAMNWFLFKDFASRNWARYTEVHGMPLRVGKYEVGTDDKEIAHLKTELISMGTDASAVISKDAMIEFVESKSHGGATVYKDLVDTADRQFSKAVLGSTTAADTAEHGNLATAQVHKGNQNMVTLGDFRNLADCINQQLVIPLLRLNFSDFNIFNAPLMKFNSDQVSNPLDFIRTLDYAYRMGKEIHPEDFAKCGLTVKENEEPLKKTTISLEDLD